MPQRERKKSVWRSLLPRQPSTERREDVTETVGFAAVQTEMDETRAVVYTRASLGRAKERRVVGVQSRRPRETRCSRSAVSVRNSLARSLGLQYHNSLRSTVRQRLSSSCQPCRINRRSVLPAVRSVPLLPHTVRSGSLRFCFGRRSRTDVARGRMRRDAGRAQRYASS